MTRLSAFLHRTRSFERLADTFVIYFPVLIAAALFPVLVVLGEMVWTFMSDAIAPRLLEHASEGSIEALLHLGAIVVALTGAYLGLDNPVRLTENADRTQSEAIDELLAAQSQVKYFLLRLGINPDHPNNEIPPLFNLTRIRILAQFAGIHVGGSLLSRFLTHLAMQKYVPLLGYFRSGAHAFVMGAFCVISLFVFLLLVAGKIWSIEWIESVPIVIVSYWLFLSAIGWSLITVAARRQLLHMRVVVARLSQALDSDIAKRYEAATAAVAEFQKRDSQNTTDPN
jgi:hypothetical protein